MTPQETVKLITESGMGLAAFAALLYGGWKVLQWLEEIKSNHLPHVQASLDRLVESSDKLLERADSHGEKLTQIVEQTKK